MTLEDANFCTDGEGTLLCLTGAVLDNNRNPGLEKLSAYDRLCRWLGVSRVIWIDTKVHEGTGSRQLRRYASFASPGHVLVGTLDSGADKAALDEIADRLRSARDATGNKLSVTRVPTFELDGELAPYTTYYTFNKAILVPQFGEQTTDDAARDVIAKCFPGRIAEPIDCRELLEKGMVLSGMFQYQPARLLDRSKATLLPKSSWHRPVPDYVGLLEEYIEQAEEES